MKTKLLFVLFLSFLSFSFSAHATTYTVTKTADTNNGSCSSTDCSLREAITAANADTSTPHTINFNITNTDANCVATTGVCTISPTTALPTITKSLTINGYSQSGASANTNDFPNALNTVITIEISGASAPNGTDGFLVNAVNVTIKGLSIHSFPSASGTYTAHGIQTLNNVGVTGLKVQGCFIGLRANGETISANKGNGVYIAGVRNTGSTIGIDGDGTDEAAERNLISGNDNYGIWMQGSSTTVAGNFIGVDKDGNTDLGNRLVGVYDAVGGNTIGTDGDGLSDEVEGNLISGNNSHGIRIAAGSNTVIAGNIIGLASDSLTTIKNSGSGIYSNTSGTGVRIGGNDDGISDAEETNTISGNGSGSSYANVYLNSSSSTISGNIIGLSADGLTAISSNAQGIWIKGNSNMVSNNDIAGHVYAGMYIDAGDSNTISENRIGITQTSSDAGNGYHGIYLAYGATYNTFQNNTIAYNGNAAGEYGLSLNSSTDDGNQFVENSFYDNQSGAIRLSSGANNNKGAPSITSQVASGSDLVISGTATSGDTIELYQATSDGQGQTSVGTTTADASGNWEISISVTRDSSLVALATDATNGTSVFSSAYTVVNQAPIAEDITLTINEDNIGSVTLTASDTEGDSLSYTIATSPAQGNVSLVDNIATYTPNANFNGSDSFNFSVSDGTDTSTATVTITVNPVNDSPVATALEATTEEDTAVGITLSGSDNDGTTLTYSLASSPTQGSVSLIGNVATYTPTANSNGTDSFSYTVSDGELATTATVSITITAANDPPTISDLTLTTDEDTTATITFDGTDAEGDAITYEAVSNTGQGTMTLGGETATFVPTANLNGAGTMTYRAFDGMDYSETKTININITPVNDPPEAEDMTAITIVDEAVTLVLGGTDPDEDDDLDYEFNSGNVTYNGTNYIYTPTIDTDGTDSFVYTVCDDEVCDNGTVTINILASSDCSQTIPESFDDLDVIMGQVSHYSGNGGTRASRRVLVEIQIYNGVTDSEREVTTSTDDSGCYYATFDGQEEEVRSVTYSASSSSAYTRADGTSQNQPDGISPDYCNGATWSC